MSTLRRVVDTPERLHLAHSHAGGWTLAALGVLGLAFSWYQLDGSGRIVGLALGALFFVAGITSALRRLDLDLDFDRGRLKYRRGFVLAPRVGEEPLDAVQRVILRKDIDRGGGGKAKEEWEVKLEVAGWPRPVEVFESRSEVAARSEAEEFARRIGVPVEQRSGR